MTCYFTLFSTVFQSYQDDGQVIMKGCVQWNLFIVETILPQAGLEIGPLDQKKTALYTLSYRGFLYRRNSIPKSFSNREACHNTINQEKTNLMYKKNVLITVTTLNTGTTRPLDKREYLMMIFVISHRNQNVVNPPLNRLGETV